jgi:hypothetical protein
MGLAQLAGSADQQDYHRQRLNCISLLPIFNVAQGFLVPGVDTSERPTANLMWFSAYFNKRGVESGPRVHQGMLNCGGILT